MQQRFRQSGVGLCLYDKERNERDYLWHFMVPDKHGEIQEKCIPTLEWSNPTLLQNFKIWQPHYFGLRFNSLGDVFSESFLHKNCTSTSIDSAETKGTPKGLVLRSYLSQEGGLFTNPGSKFFPEIFTLLFSSLSLSHSPLSLPFCFAAALLSPLHPNGCVLSSFIWNKKPPNPHIKGEDATSFVGSFGANWTLFFFFVFLDVSW